MAAVKGFEGTMGLQSNLNKTPRFSFQRAMIRSEFWSEIKRSKNIILFQMDFGLLFHPEIIKGSRVGLANGLMHDI